MSYVKNLTFHQTVLKQLHSLRTALTREVKKETTDGQQAICLLTQKHTVDQSQRTIFLKSRNLQHRNLLRDKLRAKMVIRPTTLFNLQRNNVARQVVRKCCPYYLTLNFPRKLTCQILPIRGRLLEAWLALTVG